MTSNGIQDKLTTVVGDAPPLPPTGVSMANRMLHSTLDAIARSPGLNHPLALQPGATWVSDALLPSVFRPRSLNDGLAESYTPTKAAIGHVKVATPGYAHLTVAKNATQFIVMAARMFEPLSAGVKNAPFFNQAARNVACMAEVLRRAGRSPEQFTSLGFYVLAPRVAIDAGVFSSFMTRQHVEQTVSARVAAYKGGLADWMEADFMPLLGRIDLKCITWEELVQKVIESGDEHAVELEAFYKNCLKDN